MKGTAYIDGSCIGNPGDAAYAVVLLDASGNTLISLARYIGKATNNIAEFRGLLDCLKLAEKYHIESLVIYSDSQLLVNQVNGIYKIKQPHLKEIHDAIRKTAADISVDYTIYHVGRENNKRADGLARRSARMKRDIQE